MKRRSFLRNLTMSGLGPVLLNGLPVSTLANTRGGLQQLAEASDNDRVLVLVQLHGGNDGLNTLVPLNQYDQYVNLRSNIALPKQGGRRIIPLDSTMPANQQLGLHPDTIALKNLYDRGQAAVVQSVAYQNMNGSHFRSRDVWFMGGGYNDQFDSGWAGRYLDRVFPGYPEAYPSDTMSDPLAVEIGSRVSLAFHRANGVPVAIALEDAEQYYRLVSEVGGKLPDATDGYYGEEIAYLKSVERQSNGYAERIRAVFDQGRNSGVSYPEQYPRNAPGNVRSNELSLPLRTIARLLSGGSQTKIFLARIGGFDTHAQQAEQGDTTQGTHAALLYNLFSAIEAFQSDLRSLGIAERVMTVTFSEFGRRVRSNNSLGTDHGTAAPMFVFGERVQPGVVGDNPDLLDLDQGDNLRQQYDYRQVFGTLVADWLLAPPDALNESQLARYGTGDQRLPLVAGEATSAAPAASARTAAPPAVGFEISSCYPNPAYEHAVLRYRTDRPVAVTLTLRNEEGTAVLLEERDVVAGQHEIKLRVQGFPAGTYYYTVEAGDFRETQRLQKF